MAKQVQLMPDAPEGCYWEPVAKTDDWELYVGKQLAGKVLAPEQEGGPWKAWMNPPDSTSFGGGSSPKTGKAPSREKAASDLLETIDDDWRAELMDLKSKPKPDDGGIFTEEQRESAAYNRVAAEQRVADPLPLQTLAQLADIAARTGFEKTPAKVRLRPRDYAAAVLLLVFFWALGVGSMKLWSDAGAEREPACLVSADLNPMIGVSPVTYVSRHGEPYVCADNVQGDAAFCTRLVPVKAAGCQKFVDEYKELRGERGK